MRQPQPSHYEIWVKKHLEPSHSEWLGGLAIAPGFGDDRPITILSGYLQDQSALQGVLGKLMNMGLTLLELHRLEPP